MATFSLNRPPKGGGSRTNDKSKGQSRGLPECRRRLTLTCVRHGETISVPCGRWRECAACEISLRWKLFNRFTQAIEDPPAGRQANFFTLTFPASQAPSEEEAHQALRSLVRRLRYRGLLGAYGWVLHRQKNGTLHYHGIAHMTYMDDDLKLWRRLVKASGFGIQNKLVKARPDHARYCSKYLSRGLANVARLRRAYSFSREFPEGKTKWQKIDELLAQYGIVDDDWERELLQDPRACLWRPPPIWWP